MAEVLDSVELVAATVQPGDGVTLLGEIYAVVFYYLGLDQWYQVWGSPCGYPVADIPAVPVGTVISFGLLCNNLSMVSVQGTITIDLGVPEGSIATPVFSANDLVAAPQSAWAMFVCDITLDKAGAYGMIARLEGVAV